MRLSSSLFAVYFAAVGAVPTLAAAPAAAPQYFVVCGSAPNLPTVYFSGVIQAQPAAFQQLRTGFADYLAQHFSYKGPVGCAPTNSVANAQKAVAAQSTALRNAKKNVVETGWTEGGGSACRAHRGGIVACDCIGDVEVRCAVSQSRGGRQNHRCGRRQRRLKHFGPHQHARHHLWDLWRLRRRKQWCGDWRQQEWQREVGRRYSAGRHGWRLRMSEPVFTSVQYADNSFWQRWRQRLRRAERHGRRVAGRRSPVPAGRIGLGGGAIYQARGLRLWPPQYPGRLRDRPYERESQRHLGAQ